MKFLTDDLRRKIPPLRSTEDDPDPTVVAKFFTPDSNWTWYVLEFDGEDIFFGYVVGLEAELGYFSLAELESVRGPLGLPVERDRHFVAQRLSQVKTSRVRE